MKIYKTFRRLAGVSLIIVLSLFAYHVVTSDEGATLEEHIENPPHPKNRSTDVWQHLTEGFDQDASVEHTHEAITHDHNDYPTHTHAALTHGPHTAGHDAIAEDFAPLTHHEDSTYDHDARTEWWLDDFHLHPGYFHSHSDDTSHGDGRRHYHGQTSHTHPKPGTEPAPKPEPERDPEPPPPDPALVAHRQDADAHHSAHKSFVRHTHAAVTHSHDAYPSHTHNGFEHEHPGDISVLNTHQQQPVEHSSHVATGSHTHAAETHSHDAYPSHTHNGFTHTHPQEPAPPKPPKVEPPPENPSDPQPSDDTQESDDTQPPEDTQPSDDTQQSEDTQHPANNGGGGEISRSTVASENHTIKPFDYEREGVGKVVISEWMLSPLKSRPQWIELYNTTNRTVNLRGWKIVGRFLDGNDNIHLFDRKTISRLTIAPKQTHLIAIRRTRTHSANLEDKVYSLNTSKNWRGKGLVLEIQDNTGQPIDRVGNLTETDAVAWNIPWRTRGSVNIERRISLIRRLKSRKSRKYNFKFGMTAFGWFTADTVEKLTEKKRSAYYYGHSSDIGTPGYRTEGADPLPVTLTAFTPQIAESGQVLLRWTTASELENAGFNIFRSEDKAGPFVKVNATLIQGAGTTSDRSEYTWIDTTAKPNVEYYYQIQDVSFAGATQTLATQRMKGLHTAKNRHLTPWGVLKKEQHP